MQKARLLSRAGGMCLVALNQGVVQCQVFFVDFGIEFSRISIWLSLFIGVQVDKLTGDIF